MGQLAAFSGMTVRNPGDPQLADSRHRLRQQDIERLSGDSNSNNYRITLDFVVTSKGFHPSRVVSNKIHNEKETKSNASTHEKPSSGTP